MTQQDDALLRVLRTEQFDAANKMPLPRRKLSRGTLALLILLRIYVILAIPVVAYAFIRGVSGS